MYDAFLYRLGPYSCLFWDFKVNNFKLTAIVAFDKNRGIGMDGDMPWSIPGDLVHFKKTTQNHIVIMGRRTWESLPIRPLPGRINIVITTDKFITNYEAWVVHSPEEALQVAKEVQVEKGCEIFVMGGAKIYDAFKDQLTHMVCTELDWTVPADTFFPEIPGQWIKSDEKSHTQETKHGTVAFNYYTKVLNTLQV